jgi:phenylacetate-CoA ligase
LQKFPILTKEEVRSNYAGMAADNVKEKDRIKYHTSGTSGKALDFYNSMYNLKYYWAVCARYLLRFGIKPGALSLNFTGKMVTPINQSRPPYWRYKRAQNQYMMPMVHISKEKVPAIVEFINKKGFETIVGYPSIASSFSTFVNDLGLSITSVPKYFFSGAEKVFDDQASIIESAFPGIRIVEHYGFSENAGAASKCTCGQYHEDFELGHFELNNPIVDGSFSTGILLASGFHNFAMPLIRYEVGDTLTFDNNPCKCGLKSQVISEINGRNEDYIITPEGTRIMRWDYIFKDTKTIQECQVVQKRLGEVCLRIVRRDSYSVETEKSIMDKIHTLISPTISVVFEYVNEIPRTKAGKFKAVVSEIHS